MLRDTEIRRNKHGVYFWPPLPSSDSPTARYDLLFIPLCDQQTIQPAVITGSRAGTFGPSLLCVHNDPLEVLDDFTSNNVQQESSVSGLQ